MALSTSNRYLLSNLATSRPEQKMVIVGGSQVGEVLTSRKPHRCSLADLLSFTEEWPKNICRRQPIHPHRSYGWCSLCKFLSFRACLEFFARTPGVIFSCLKKDHYVPLINMAWFAVEELGYSLLGNLLYLWMRKHETRLMCFLKSAARQACFHATRHDGFAGNPSLPERTYCPTVFMCRIAVSSLCPNLLEAFQGRHSSSTFMSSNLLARAIFFFAEQRSTPANSTMTSM